MKTELIDTVLLADVRREVLHKACSLIANLKTPEMIRNQSDDYYNGFQIGILAALSVVAKIEP